MATSMKKHPIRIGFLGGGQLARMMALAAAPLGVEPWVLSPHKTDPAAQVTAFWMQGDPNNLRDLKQFFNKVDVVTFESEFFEADLMIKASQAARVKVFPRPQVMAKIQDRWTQKQALEKAGVPTARYYKVDNYQQALAALDNLGGSMVLKKRRMGYDGYGTYIIRKSQDLHSIKDLINQTPYGFIAEEFIPFQRELALMIGRSQIKSPEKEKWCLFPLVETFQEKARCLWVKGPVTSKKKPPLVRSLKKLLNQLNYVGMMGVELFETKNGDLIVNELAPRVHNSGHYSQDALVEDQFTAHIKAILGLSLDPPKLVDKGFAMWNLLGEGKQVAKWQSPKKVHVHWYGKAESRVGRKMGHINATATSSKQALARVKKARSLFKI